MGSSREPISAHEVPPKPKGASGYPKVFAARVAGRQKHALGDYFGLKNFGVNLTILDPGAETALRHRHLVQDEFIYILRGRPTLVTDRGEKELQAGMCVGFPAGGEDAHHFINRSDEPAELLQVGDRLPGDVGSYPDDDLEARQDSAGKWRFFHKDGRLYDG